MTQLAFETLNQKHPLIDQVTFFYSFLFGIQLFVYLTHFRPLLIATTLNKD